MGGILSAFSGEFVTIPKIAEFIIAPLDSDGNIDTSLGGAKTLQYWPESIDEEFSANWQEKLAVGSALPIYQWVSGAARPVSFTAVFSRDLDGEIPGEVEEDKFNVDVDAAIAWLRSLSLPDYADIGDVRGAAISPPVLWLMTPGMKIGHNSLISGGASLVSQAGISVTGQEYSSFYCILLSGSVSRTNWFQSGRTRYATVSLSFAEVMQVGQGIYPYGRSALNGLANLYNRRAK